MWNMKPNESRGCAETKQYLIISLRGSSAGLVDRRKTQSFDVVKMFLIESTHQMGPDRLAHLCNPKATFFSSVVFGENFFFSPAPQRARTAPDRCVYVACSRWLLFLWYIEPFTFIFYISSRSSKAMARGRLRLGYQRAYIVANCCCAMLSEPNCDGGETPVSRRFWNLVMFVQVSKISQENSR